MKCNIYFSIAVFSEELIKEFKKPIRVFFYNHDNRSVSE